MNEVFFEQLEIRDPDCNLGIGSGAHGKMTGAMLEGIERVLVKEKPECVLVYGDTNSTLAGALAAAKLHISIAHVEAGLRSFNRQMPEEINRVLTDHVSTFLFCPTGAAVENLQREGIHSGVHQVGDVMYDSFFYNRQLAEKKSTILSELDLRGGCYCLVTVHREENTENTECLRGIFAAVKELAQSDCPFVVPLHPRTAKAMTHIRETGSKNPCVRILEPVSYLDMVMLETNAKVIFTDSGGVQKEAYFAKTPCITLRNETEWVELVDRGVNIVAGSDTRGICQAYEKIKEKNVDADPNLYGDGQASEKIVLTLLSEVSGG
jgi:UDP-N-acetylglucosamine 2-epimerase